MPSLKKRDDLAIEHLDWALSIARRVAGMLPTWFVLEDLTGPATIALVAMADKYDPSLGVPFRAYAHRRIYGACFDSVRRREYQERGHLTISDGLSHWVDYSVVHPEQILEYGEIQVPDDAPSPEARAASEDQQKVWALVQLLPSRHALVILAMYGGGMTVKNLAGLMGLGMTRVSQLHLQALGMLRKSGVNGSLARSLASSLVA